ncbi:3-oxoacyl-[acyl-carrier-protein] synthase-3 [Myceligenerans xiligouense]|uniref:3-oxoacyl-[acyl-carrier-protein] synthase-3 n=1 Tax=Myceligenerans xiligouense TaxID=253184 RepID=A0A3N4YLF7_9MICO|nr:3-oxoacyl-[acyl-carrier-protein] synthase-3 [Myceligenerans xiligouense]
MPVVSARVATVCHVPIETTAAVEPSTAVVPELPQPVARVAGVAFHLPAETRDVAEVERDLHRRNPKVAPRVPMVSRLTGARTIHVAADDEQASDLAVAAARKVLAGAGLAASDVDLLIFASASQDMVEPATAHITAAKLGAACPVMDVKNACNSVLNGMEVAEALIGTGRYRRVLIACGEVPSRAVRWDVPDRATYALSAPGYTMSDAGAAVLVEAVDDAAGLDAELAGLAGEAPSGILASAFSAASRHWDVGMLPGGGTFNPRDPERSYFEIDGSRLREAFDELGPEVAVEAMAKAGVTWDDIRFVAVHQVAVAYLDDVFGSLGVPRERTIVTIADHGNVASATLPLQLGLAEQAGRLRRGDVALLVGLAGGISMGAMVVRW